MRKFSGYLLTILGIIFLIFSFLGVSGLGGLYLSRGEELTDHFSRAGIVGPFVTGSIMLIAGLILIEGKKNSILFLRPFHSYSNTITMTAFSKKMGNSFTIIALDDGNIPSPKYSALDSAIALFFLIPSAILLMFFAAAAMPMSYESNDILDMLPTGIAIYFSLQLFKHSFNSLFPFLKRNKYIIKNQSSLNKSIYRVIGLPKWGLRIFSPRSLIFKSTNEMWKASVENIGKVSNFALLDISNRSESINWEINFLKNSMSGKFIVMINSESMNNSLRDEFGAYLIEYKKGALREFEKNLKAKFKEISEKNQR